jgi:hypothetical protein
MHYNGSDPLKESLSLSFRTFRGLRPRAQAISTIESVSVAVA